MAYHGAAKTVDYELTKAEKAALDAETIKSGEIEAGIGGAAGGAASGSPAAAVGGGLGAGLAGRIAPHVTKPLTAAETLEVAASPEEVTERVRTALAAHGRTIDDPNDAGDGSLWGIVGTGMGGLAKALVRVAVEPSGSGGSRVELRGTGAEGLIKAHVGRKGIDKIAADIAD